MKAHTKRRRAAHKMAQQFHRLEKRQNRLVGEVVRAVTHLLDERVPIEPVPDPEQET